MDDSGMIYTCRMLMGECVRNVENGKLLKNFLALHVGSTGVNLPVKHAMPQDMPGFIRQSLALVDLDVLRLVGTKRKLAESVDNLRRLMNSPLLVTLRLRRTLFTKAGVYRVPRNVRVNGTGTIKNVPMEISVSGISKFFMALRKNNTTIWSKISTALVQSAETAGMVDFTSTMTIKPAQFVDCSAIDATVPWGYLRMTLSSCVELSHT